MKEVEERGGGAGSFSGDHSEARMGQYHEFEEKPSPRNIICQLVITSVKFLLMVTIFNRFHGLKCYWIHLFVLRFKLQ